MWFQLKIEQCISHEIETMNEALEDCNALSIMLTDKNDDPVLEPAPGTTPLWPEVIIHALFATVLEAQQAQAQLNQIWPHLLCSIEPLPDKDWERAWMDDFKPQRFGRRLWICPTWCTPPDPNAVNLMLDPGLAFGTGPHPTTALCLGWLENENLKDASVIDYGCGSGILSLAALKLGALQVTAVDIDPQALQATYNNAAGNSLKEPQLIIGHPNTLECPVDLIIANILLAPLIDLKNRFSELLHPKATLVVSGVLQEQAEQLITSYHPVFIPVSTQYRDGWALVVFTRP